MLRAILLTLSALLAVPAFGQGDAPRLAKIATVAVQDAATTRQFFGHVAARETVDLAFQVGGQVVEIPIVEGEPVAKGALIAQLDLEPFEIALDQARVNLDQAQRTLERLRKLEGSTVSQVSVDDAETQVSLAEIGVRNAEVSLRDASLMSPFDGLVAARNVANFSTISAGTPVARLHDMSDLRIEIDVPEILFQQAGQNPDVRLVAKFPASDTEYPLEIREFNAETSEIGQTFRITLGMTPPDDLVVLPGSSVTVFATLIAGPTSLRIPMSAVVTDNAGNTQVMVFAPAGADEGTVAVRDVTIMPGTRGEVLVTSGLEPGEEIVASGANLLSDGDAVRRFAGFTN